jgi:hypothetical protein
MRYIAQAGLALALLIGLPIALDPPATDESMIAAAIGALVLVAVAIHGIVRYVRSRKPRAYLDSVMPPIEPPRK